MGWTSCYKITETIFHKQDLSKDLHLTSKEIYPLVCYLRQITLHFLLQILKQAPTSNQFNNSLFPRLTFFNLIHSIHYSSFRPRLAPRPQMPGSCIVQESHQSMKKVIYVKDLSSSEGQFCQRAQLRAFQIVSEYIWGKVKSLRQANPTQKECGMNISHLVKYFIHYDSKTLEK